METPDCCDLCNQDHPDPQCLWCDGTGSKNKMATRVNNELAFCEDVAYARAVRWAKAQGENFVLSAAKKKMSERRYLKQRALFVEEYSVQDRFFKLTPEAKARCLRLAARKQWVDGCYPYS
jgi:hypothetical protein